MKTLCYSLLALLLITSCSIDQEDEIYPENESKNFRMRSFGSCSRSIATWSNATADHLEDLIQNCSPQTSARHGDVIIISSAFNEFGSYTSNGSSIFGLKIASNSGNVAYSLSEQDQIVADAKAAAAGWIENLTQTDPAYYSFRNKTPHITYNFTADSYPGIPAGYFFSLEITYVYEKPAVGYTHM